MRRMLFLCGVLATVLMTPPVSPFCPGAVLAQERRLPQGEWCQRPPARSKQAHVCGCHQHACNVDPNDINNHSAHTDVQCLSYCRVADCRCEKDDCP